MEKKKILVIGKYGQLASELMAVSNLYDDFHITFTGKDEIDLLQPDFEQKLLHLSPDIIINSSAYTFVDKAEIEIEQAVKLNSIAPAKISRLCASLNIPFIHISSDYVYDVNNGYPLTEKHQTNPQSLYGITKLNGEKLVLHENPKSIIIRTSWLYSSFGNNFVKTMLKLCKERQHLTIVDDQFGCPTYVEDLAIAILEISKKILFTDFQAWGIYNFANEGVTNWKDFAAMIFNVKKIEINITGIDTSAYNAPAKRPLWSVLSLQKIKTEFNLTIPHWKDALIRCLSKL